MKPHFPALILALTLPLTATADEISDALQAAQDAYAAGDVQYAIEELDFARQKLLALKTDSLSAFLPPAPDGWTREINTEMNAGLAMMGGGVGAEADYVAENGGPSVKITMMADNPMVAGMAAMVANAGAMGLKTERIGRQRFALQDNQVIGMVGNRVLVQAEGESTETVMALLAQIDFDALAAFGQ